MAHRTGKHFRKLLRQADLIRTAKWIRLVGLGNPRHRFSCIHSLIREAARWNHTGLNFRHLLQRFDGWLRERRSWSHREFGSFCASEGAFLQTSSQPSIAALQHVVNTVQLRDFTLYYLGITTATAGAGLSEEAEKAEMAQTLGLLQNKYALEQEISKRGLWVSGKNGFFWMSPQGVDQHAGLGDAGPGKPLPAERVRHMLGLAHFSQSEGEMISLRIDKDRLAVPHTPTAFDACGYPFFRPALRDDGWGETIDLSRIKRGVREAIHSGIQVTEGVQVVVLGKLDKGRIRLNWRQWGKLLRESERELQQWCRQGKGQVQV